MKTVSIRELHDRTDIYSHDKHLLAAGPTFGLVGKDMLP